MYAIWELRPNGIMTRNINNLVAFSGKCAICDDIPLDEDEPLPCILKPGALMHQTEWDELITCTKKSIGLHNDFITTELKCKPTC